MFQKEQIKIINMASSYCDTLNGYLIRLAIKLVKTKYAEENYCGVILQNNKYFFLFLGLPNKYISSTPKN